MNCVRQSVQTVGVRALASLTLVLLGACHSATQASDNTLPIEPDNQTTSESTVAVPAPSASAASASRGVHGTLVREGKTLRLETLELRLSAKRCSDPGATTLVVGIGLRAEDSRLRIEENLVAIQVDESKLRAGQRYDPDTAAGVKRHGRTPDAAVSVLAWISGPGRATEAALPSDGWVKVNANSSSGPVDVSFEISFGEMGQVDGHIVIPTIQSMVCRSPSPPRPPR